MDWPGSTEQLSNRYTAGAPSANRYCAKFPKVLAELAEIGHEPVIPVCHPFNRTTGGLAVPAGTAAMGFTVT